MDRVLSDALKDLGLSPTESAIYVGLLEHCSDGPVSAYKLAKELGRDPANMTKGLAAAVKRGAALTSGKRPKLYAPVPPREYISSLVANLQERQEQAVTLLEELGTPPPDDGRPHPLDERAEALSVARRLLAGAERVVLVNASTDWISELQDDLDRASQEQGAMVVVRNSHLVTAPGPWLRLAVDGRMTLNVVAQTQGDLLLFGEWSSNPARAYLQHRELSQAAVLDDLTELLNTGAPTGAVKRRADEQLPQLLASVPWKRRWQEAELEPYVPQLPAEPQPEPEPAAVTETPAPESEVADLDPATVAEAMAEVAAEFTPEVPGVAPPTEPSLDTPIKAPPPTEDVRAESAEEEAGGPLRFIFRRRRTD